MFHRISYIIIFEIYFCAVETRDRTSGERRTVKEWDTRRVKRGRVAIQFFLVASQFAVERITRGWIAMEWLLLVVKVHRLDVSGCLIKIGSASLTAGLSYRCLEDTFLFPWKGIRAISHPLKATTLVRCLLAA